MANITGLDEDHLYKLMMWLATAPEDELIAVARPLDRSRNGAAHVIAHVLIDDHDRASHPAVIPGLIELDLLPGGWA